MGGEDRASGSKMSKSGNSKLVRHESVTDPVISKLLKDFTSAKLFQQSGDLHHYNINKSKSDCTWNEVILSLKHLHVRRPDFKKHRRVKKNSQASKGSTNLLNLAIAAGNLQRPIVWPARLNCDCKKSNTSMLIPSKLKISEKSFTCCSRNKSVSQSEDTNLGKTCSLCKGKNSERQMSSKQQATHDLFGYASNVSSLSFNTLCLQQSSANTLNTARNVCKSKKESGAGCKIEGVCTTLNTTSNKQRLLFSGKQLFTNIPVEPLPSSDILCSSSNQTDGLPSSTVTGAPAIYAKSSTQTSLTTAVPGASNSLPSHRIFHHSFASTAQHSGPTTGPGRSCSQQMRDTEDTNVNELASYLDDLLHIPRKMSTMAEMMYA